MSSTGNLAGITAPGGGTLSYGYDGSLPTSVAWGGEVLGSVGFGYDDDLRVSSVSVNGTSPIALGYDGDGLLTAAGALTITRDAATGLLDSTALGSGIPDGHTGLVRFGARDYEPGAGRWTAKDPIGFGGASSNLYEYSKNNPVSVIDITGFDPLSDCMIDFFEEIFEKFDTDIDLTRVRIKEGMPLGPRLLQDARAYTMMNTIHFRDGFTESDPGAVLLLAHELVHVSQWQTSGVKFQTSYAMSYLANLLGGMDNEAAYLNTKGESEARYLARRVSERLPGGSDKRSPCPTRLACGV